LADVARTYRDYLRECEQLGLNMADRAVLFPPDLNAAHQRTMKMIAFESDRALNEKLAERAASLRKFILERDGFMIRPAENSEEFKEEGAALGHCVGGYAKDMAEGKIAIFFVRPIHAPDKPYFTLELKGKQVTQCRTKDNKPYEGAVKAFVDAWAAEVVAKGGRKRVRV
jgi:hypothetical protein